MTHVSIPYFCISPCQVHNLCANRTKQKHLLWQVTLDWPPPYIFTLMRSPRSPNRGVARWNVDDTQNVTNITQYSAVFTLKRVYNLKEKLPHCKLGSCQKVPYKFYTNKQYCSYCDLWFMLQFTVMVPKVTWFIS